MKPFRQVAISDQNIKIIKEFLYQQEKENEVISSLISDSELDENLSSRAKNALQYMNRKFIDGVPDIDQIAQENDSPWHRVASNLDLHSYDHQKRLSNNAIAQLKSLQSNLQWENSPF